LELLATGVEGNQTAQTFTVNYADGSSTQIVQSFSDWYTPSAFPGESVAVSMAYRNFDDGTHDTRPFSLYAYRLMLNPAKIVRSIVLPDDAGVVVLAGTLTRN